MKRKLTSILLTTCMLLMSVGTLRAGGALESIDVTAGPPSPIPGHIIARVIGIRWDARSIPARMERAESLTQENIHAAIRKYIPADRYTIISLMPEAK